MMKFGFTTCVQLGLSCMEEIYLNGGELALVLTLPDEVAPHKAGRVYLDDFCIEHNIPLHKVKTINDPEAERAIISHSIDWLFIIGWSQIAGKSVLAAPRHGILGIHPTLLPEGRGRAAIPWAIIKGLQRTGVTLFKLDESVDTGPIVAQEIIAMGPEESATELYAKVNQAHRKLISDVWPVLLGDRIQLKKQDESRASVWPARTPEDGRISNDMCCSDVDRLVRATTHPYPGAFFDTPIYRLRIWKGKTEVRREGQPASAPGIEGGVAIPIIMLKDGSYRPLDYEKEPLPPKIGS